MNYYNKMLEILEEVKGKKPTILLHSCCAPCSSAVILTLKDYFDITILYYNPNIEPDMEYLKRKEEQIRFIKELDLNIKFLDCSYDHEEFIKISKGLEKEKEGGARCFKCYNLRLEKTASLASLNHYDFFGTTLTVSPYKNSEVLNNLGKVLESNYNVRFLYADFKKHDGYKKSIELAKKYNLYRQDYCGCNFSKLERIEHQKSYLINK